MSVQPPVSTSVPAQSARQSQPPVDGSTAGLNARHAAIILALLVVLALVLRFDGLSRRTFGHPENFAPGLNVPEWVKYPPPRNDLRGIYEGTLIDGHPPGYFVAMLPWVKAFGTSLLALRLPSALLGALSVLLLYRFARKESDQTTALLAAAFLALNGHHIFWSQMARMYVPIAAFGLLSCLLLWRVIEQGRAKDKVAYFATLTAMLWTQLYCWPLLLAQMVWSTLHSLRAGKRPPALTAQFAAIIAASPVIQLSMYQNPPTQWRQSALEYFGFGYAFYSESLFFGERHPLAVLSIPLVVVCFVLIALALRNPAELPAHTAETSENSGSSMLGVIAAAVIATAIMIAFPLIAPPGKAGRAQLLAVAILPLVLVIGLLICHRLLAALARGKLHERLRNSPLPGPLSLWLALMPWGVMFTLSVLRPSFVARGALIFVPFLLLVLARAVRSLMRSKLATAFVLTIVFALHVGSVLYFRKVESSGRDYRTLAARLREQVQPSDVILLRNRFSQPPLLYYLPEYLDQFVPLEQLRNRPLEPSRRVWVVEFEEPGDSTLYRAVRDRQELSEVTAYGSRAVLFAPSQ
jgi:4-amino-4-deoxy-L-arabinose transferase-like glycosyltransferase